MIFDRFFMTLSHFIAAKILASCCIAGLGILLFMQVTTFGQDGDFVARLQKEAIANRKATWGHWGPSPDSYNGWTNHSNRLIPVYVFGDTLKPYINDASIYRDPERLQQLYQRVPERTTNPTANYADQTDVYRLQRNAIQKGKKQVILIVFDGMDWQTTWAAANYVSKRVAYVEGRGTGLVIQDYRGVETDFGYFVTSPHDEGLGPNVDLQILTEEPVQSWGGYNPKLGGETPWAKPADIEYLISRSRACPHAYTDSSSSATSMTAGVKTFNGSVNVMPDLTRWKRLLIGYSGKKG